MKYSQKISLLFLSLLLTTACQDQLDLTPISGISVDTYFNNPTEVKSGVYAMYDGLQAIPLREFAVTEMRSDNTNTNLHEGDWRQLESLDVLPTNSAVSLYYASCYNAIFRANLVLENLDVVTSDTDRKLYEGEAKFVRALTYFNLVRAFGGVPLIDKVILASESYSYARATEQEIYSLIISDLTTAKNQLTGRSGVPEGRATTGAAAALLAKVYLTTKDYANAKSLLDALVAGTEYALRPVYRDVFYTERNVEIIFAMQYINDNAAESQDYSREFTTSGTARGLNYPTSNFKAAVTAGDLRIATLYHPTRTSEVGKFVTTSTNLTYCGNDWIVLRFADVLLMHSESILAGANATSDLEAIKSYNKIRVRAGLSVLPTDGSGSLTSQMLLDERRVELAFENHRFYDLIRFGVAESVLGAFATAEGFTFTPSDLLLPIPQREVDTSFGSITQNPGY
jgi:starch-binding outer membrane protein, SusD/RagB family